MRRLPAYLLVPAYVLAILGLLSMIYFGAYIVLGKRGAGMDKQTGRILYWQAFRHDWQHDLFGPAAAIESFVLNKNVCVAVYPSD